MWKRLWKKKTFKTGVAALIVSIVEASGIEIPPEVYKGLAALATMFISHGFAKLDAPEK